MLYRAYQARKATRERRERKDRLDPAESRVDQAHPDPKDEGYV